MPDGFRDYLKTIPRDELERRYSNLIDRYIALEKQVVTWENKDGPEEKEETAQGQDEKYGSAPQGLRESHSSVP